MVIATARQSATRPSSARSAPRPLRWSPAGPRPGGRSNAASTHPNRPTYAALRTASGNALMSAACSSFDVRTLPPLPSTAMITKILSRTRNVGWPGVARHRPTSPSRSSRAAPRHRARTSSPVITPTPMARHRRTVRARPGPCRRGRRTRAGRSTSSGHAPASPSTPASSLGRAAIACAVSSAGRMPSVRVVVFIAATASRSVAAATSIRPPSASAASCGPIPG